jgi:hypothetical protein
MAAKDFFHDTVKEVLIDDSWTITDDPLKVIYGEANYQIDLGAERVIAAEKENEKIAVEIKTFSEASFIYAFHAAFGQYLNYKRGLRKQGKKHELFLAVTVDIYKAHFTQIMVQDAIKEDDLKVIIFNPKTKKIEQWIK